MVKVLLKYGADVTLQNDQGETALEVASDEMKKLILSRLQCGVWEGRGVWEWRKSVGGEESEDMFVWRGEDAEGRMQRGGCRGEDAKRGGCRGEDAEGRMQRGEDAEGRMQRGGCKEGRMQRGGCKEGRMQRGGCRGRMQRGENVPLYYDPTSLNRQCYP